MYPRRLKHLGLRLVALAVGLSEALWLLKDTGHGPRRRMKNGDTSAHPGVRRLKAENQSHVSTTICRFSRLIPVSSEANAGGNAPLRFSPAVHQRRAVFRVQSPRTR